MYAMALILAMGLGGAVERHNRNRARVTNLANDALGA
jgi:hypothetical protein